MDKNLTIAGLFAGVGGIEKGFKSAGFTPVLSNEIDKSASITFRANNHHPLIEGDIHDLSHKAFPQGLTVLAGGFPCQPFSVAGYRKALMTTEEMYSGRSTGSTTKSSLKLFS